MAFSCYVAGTLVYHDATTIFWSSTSGATSIPVAAYSSCFVAANPTDSVAEGFVLAENTVMSTSYTRVSGTADSWYSPFPATNTGSSVQFTASPLSITDGISADSTTLTSKSSIISSDFQASPSTTVLSNAASQTRSSLGISSTSTLSSSASKNGTDVHGKIYDAGVVAGAAVGAAIGAAILAALIVFLCLRKRRSGKNAGQHREHTPDLVIFGKGPGSQMASEESHHPVNGLAWMKQLPQPADDNTMVMKVKTLFHQIQLHVENFYQNTNVRGSTISDEGQEALMDLDSELLPSSLPAAILNSSASTTVITHVLAHLIIRSISVDTLPGDSFLPGEFAGLPQDFMKQENNHSRSAFVQSLSHYRIMTVYLRPDAPTNPQYLSQRDEKIQLAAGTFAAAFHSWAKNPSKNSATSLQNLKEIMRSAAETGIFVFTQPTTFEYQWSGMVASSKKSQRVVALPAFVKVADERGVRLEKPMVMIDPVVERM